MTTHQPDQSRMTIDLPTIEHQKIKALAAFFGISIKELVLSSVRDTYFNETNDETKKAIREVEEGKNIIHCKDFDDFVKTLGFD